MFRVVEQRNTGSVPMLRGNKYIEKRNINKGNGEKPI